ncbi:MAG: glutamyl-tRNA reductase [Thermoguttaceae bacterium]
MRLAVVGCSHHNATIEVREKLAFSPTQINQALECWQTVFPQVEAVLLSTCNRVEIYLASESDSVPTLEQLAAFLAEFHGLEPSYILPYLYLHCDEEAVGHLFSVGASLDSMVIGEPQILAQVKEAYKLAMLGASAGPLMHVFFQAALHAARRVAGETALNRRRVSVPSVAIGDFARQIFERFDDKHVLVIGAGEMAEETLRYLDEAGVHQISIINRNYDRAGQLAAAWHGRAIAWDQLHEALATADLVVSATGSGEPVILSRDYARIHQARFGRPQFILDLAVPRDFEPAVGEHPDVYLYSIDDLQAACDRNKTERDKELPKAKQIIDEETERFMTQWRHRAVGPVIERLYRRWQKPKEQELQRLFNKLPELDDRARDEINQSFDRLVNKLLHSPLASLRDESAKGASRTLIDALRKLFSLRD